MATPRGFEALRTRNVVTTFDAREGVLMDRDAIRPIAAKRGLAKNLFEFPLRKIGREAESNPDEADLRPPKNGIGS